MKNMFFEKLCGMYERLIADGVTLPDEEKEFDKLVSSYETFVPSSRKCEVCGSSAQLKLKSVDISDNGLFFVEKYVCGCGAYLEVDVPRGDPTRIYFE